MESFTFLQSSTGSLGVYIHSILSDYLSLDGHEKKERLAVLRVI